MEAEKIDIVVLAGFLGAGKTTVLNELIRFFPGRRIGILVNDFGEVPVDGSLLVQEHPELLEGGHKVYEIGNGSIFCSCLKAPFLYGLKHFADERPEILFIESSGMSDPSSMDRILAEHGMVGHFRVHRILTLVDPVKYEGLSHVLNVIDRQLAAADHILVNKADLVSEEELQTVMALIKEKSSAPVQSASFGRFDYSFIHEESGRFCEPERESCNTPDTRPASLFLEGPVKSREALESFMKKSGSEVYRIKGFLELEGQMRYVSDNSRGFSIIDAKKPDIHSGLTVLCPPEAAGRVKERWQILVRKDTPFGFRQGAVQL